MRVGALAGVCTIALSAVLLLGACESQKPASAPEAAVDTSAGPIVDMKTTQGDVKIQVDKRDAPITSNNFLDLVDKHFYDGLTFHRYEPGFVIQGGDPNGNGTGGYLDPQTHRERTIPLEKSPNLNHGAAGVVAMARSNNPDSASSQFYITLAPAPFLDQPPGYAVFGKVVSGMDSVMKLRAGDKIVAASVEK